MRESRRLRKLALCLLAATLLAAVPVAAAESGPRFHLREVLLEARCPPQPAETWLFEYGTPQSAEYLLGGDSEANFRQRAFDNRAKWVPLSEAPGSLLIDEDLAEGDWRSLEVWSRTTEAPVYLGGWSINIAGGEPRLAALAGSELLPDQEDVFEVRLGGRCTYRIRQEPGARPSSLR